MSLIVSTVLDHVKKMKVQKHTTTSKTAHNTRWCSGLGVTSDLVDSDLLTAKWTMSGNSYFRCWVIGNLCDKSYVSLLNIIYIYVYIICIKPKMTNSHHYHQKTKEQTSFCENCKNSPTRIKKHVSKLPLIHDTWRKSMAFIWLFYMFLSSCMLAQAIVRNPIKNGIDWKWWTTNFGWWKILSHGIHVWIICLHLPYKSTTRWFNVPVWSVAVT